MDGVLTLFPERGLDQSILVVVLVGIYVLLFFTEVFGWVWAGLVVPGYLASVFAVQPAAGVAISFEAVLTFVASRAVSDVMSRMYGWSPFFGRERFFLIVLVSVVVRQASELWLIDDLLGWIDGVADAGLATAHDFSSIGLVLVPLLANMFWKLTLPRGVFQIGVSVAITWAIAALVLLPYTNLSFSSFELTYEDVALDFLGSPKAYIILLTTAFIAAHANLLYGWDYNGILVPSLIALTWFEPFTLVVTVGEALVLYGATRLVMLAPVLRRMNLEGPRKVTLVFTVGFLLKFAAGWVIGERFPELRLTDFYGFGYVLTSLLAVKMINTKKVGRVVLPSIFISLVGFGLGSAIGFALELALPREPTPLPALARGDGTSDRLMATPAGAMAAATVRARPELPARHRHGLPARSLAGYAELWRDLDVWLDDGRVDTDGIEAKAAALGLALRPLDGARAGWALYEAEERLHLQLGWEIALLFPGAPGPVIEVPRPRRERPAAEAAVVLCARLDCRAIVASGVDGVDGVTAADPLAHARSTFHVAHRGLVRSPVVQLRADERATPGTPRLHLRHSIPNALRLPALWHREVELTWEPPPGAALAWEARSDLAVLRVHPDDLWTLLAGAGAAPRAVDGTVARWLAGRPSGEVRVRAPSPTELRVLEELLIERLAAREPARAPWIAALAGALDHELVWLPDGVAAGAGAWLLTGRDGPGWITVAIAERPATPLVLEVPRPRTEVGSVRLAAEAWIAARGAALVVDTEATDAPDPTAPGNVATPLQAAHQALYRAVAAEPGAAVVQVRGFAAWRPAREDMIVSLGVPLLDAARAPAPIARVVGPDGALGRLAGSRRWVDGGADVADLGGAGTPQLLYAQAMVGPPFAIVWFAEAVRARTAPSGDAGDLRARAARFGLRFAERPVADALLAPTTARGRIAPRVVALAEEYARTGDVAALAELAARAGDAASLGWSPDLGLGYVLVEGGDARVALVTGPARREPCPPIEGGADVAAAVWAAVQARCPRIELRRRPPR